MALPPLLYCKSEAEYQAHFERIYCHGSVLTFDKIRVYFKRNKFRHAFYESSNRDGVKDYFSPVRAQRMNWIEATLVHPEASLYLGWDKGRRRYDATHRVCVAYDDFIVVIRLYLNGAEALEAEFITCYQADNSIAKITGSPKWTMEKCLADLRNKKGR